MDIKYLEKLIAQKETEQKITEQGLEREKRLATIIAQRDARIEEDFHGEKAKLALKIFEWVSSFSASEVGKRLQSISRDPHGVYVFHDGWGHQVPHYDGFGIWSRVYVTPKGDLCYFAGFKYAGGAERKLASSDELAGYLNYHYISKLWDAIETEKVYENAVKWHLRR